MLDWIFEGIVTWISSVVSDMMDAVSGLFLQALGTDMTAMEEYFPFVSKSFTVMQYTAWALLFLITVWQLFRVFGGPVTEAENPWVLLGRSALFAFLIGYAKPIFLLTLKIATAPYTALMDIQMTAEDFTFAGIEQALQNGLTSLIATISVVGLLLLTILEIALGWNYFKLLLETVERYIVVGVLCYTSPLAFSMGASKATTPVFRSWCRMVGSQLLLLVMNVWFLRGFLTSVGQYIGTGGALSNGNGNVFLWLFCAVAFLKTAQKFDSYLAAMGLNVAQTGSGMGMELLMAARVITGVAGGARSACSVFRGGSAATGTGAAATGFAAGFANRFKGNSYVRDAVVDGGTRIGAGGTIGFVGRAFGGMAARNGATLTGESISSVASRTPNVSGSIGGDIANRSLGNYMPHMKGMDLSDTQITGGHISTKVIGADGKETAVEMFNSSQFEKPDGPHAVVNTSDGSQWYQMAGGSRAGAFYDAPVFSGNSAEAAQVAAAFPDADGATLRTVGDGVIEASSDGGVSRWYNSAYYDEPDAPHSTIQAANGVEWYAMQQHAETPPFEAGDAADGYNRAQFQSFMPGYEQPVTSVDGSGRMDGHFEVRHENGSGTMFYDTSQYAPPRGEDPYIWLSQNQCVDLLSATQNAADEIISQMRNIAETIPEYKVLRAMHGVGDRLGSIILAEIGDVHRFHSGKALNSYAGNDAPPYQSGQFESRNRHISKRGSSTLRKACYEVMQALKLTKPQDDPVYLFMLKKEQEGKPFNVAKMAGVNKFLRIYYARAMELYK